MAANAGLAGTNFDLNQGVANLIHACASRDLIDKWVPKIVSGECFGTMCLSEPHAGSSLTDVRYNLSRCRICMLMYLLSEDLIRTAAKPNAWTMERIASREAKCG